MFSTQTILTNIPKALNIFLEGHNHCLHNRQPEIDILQKEMSTALHKCDVHDVMTGKERLRR